jgi:hypothetical protein
LGYLIKNFYAIYKNDIQYRYVKHCQAASSKQQATSNKQQATSNKQ